MSQFKSTLFTGNVAITGNITIAGDIIAKAATQAVAGLMSAEDKTKLDGIQTQLDGKAPSVHSHTKSQITDFPTSLPASDVYDWAKSSTKPSYTASEVGLGSVRNVASYSQTESDARYLRKTTYEWNKEISFGQTGYLLIGKFPMYDSNITIDINSTTSNTYHGTLVIATQNINTSRGGSYTCTVYGDATGTVSSALRVQYSSGSNKFNVYFQPPAWSKNLIHIKALALPSAPTETEICTSISSVPTTDLLTITNALSANYFPLSGGNITGALGISNLITQGSPSSDSTITSMNRFAADLFVSGNGSAPNSPKVAGFYLGKSATDENRHMDIVSGGDYSYIDFNKASVVNDYQARLLVNVTTGATEWLWNAGTKTFSFTGGTVSASSFVENGTALSSKYASKSTATTSANGLMSASDKTKLNSLYNQPDMETQDFLQLTVSDSIDFDFDYGCREYIIIIESAGGNIHIGGGYYSGVYTDRTAIIKMSMVDDAIYAGIMATDEGNSGIIVLSGTELYISSQDSSDIAISVMGY